MRGSFFLFFLPVLTQAPAVAEPEHSGVSSEIKSDERVVFFPTLGRRQADGSWLVGVHGWIHEPEEGSKTRAAILSGLKRVVGVPRGSLLEDEAARKIFETRVRAFLVDNERGKRIAVRFGSETFVLPVKSEANGHFRTSLELSADVVAQRVDDADGTMQLDFAAVTAADDSRRFAGRVALIPPTGVSVISDIDDTVKITDVTATKAMIQNTFLREFRAVPGMADLYQRWAAQGASLHWVSSSPWQLYEPLAEFLRAAGFPHGSFHLKLFRMKDSTFLDLFASSEETKPRAIEPLFEEYPGRTFRLVGDSGEHDPEVYGAMARKYPKQVEGVFIRNVTEEIDTARFEAAFVGVPKELWQVFRSAEEIKR
jgi:phosphatidate phosphatase APP1